MRNQIVEEIMKLVNDKVKIDNYDLLCDRGEQGMGGLAVVLHAKDSMDFSDDILTALNKNRPQAQSANAAAPAPAAPSLKH